MIFSLLLLILAGCGAIAANKNSAALMRLNVGDTKERVIEIMGPPRKREVYGSNEYLFYKTAIGSTDMETYTPILIANGKVTGWGREYYKAEAKTKPDVDTKSENALAGTGGMYAAYCSRPEYQPACTEALRQLVVRAGEVQSEGKPVVCAPPGATVMQGILISRRFIADNPQLLHYDLPNIVLASLMKAFPCT